MGQGGRAHMMATTTVLELTEVTKRYGNQVAVDRVGFRVLAGEIVGLLGPNGAGKTTTINMVLGVLRPDDGQIRIAGRDVVHQRSQALALSNFSAVYASLPGNLTVLQNLRVFGRIYDVRHLEDRIEFLINRFSLKNILKQKCGVLSSGEMSRVCLAKSFLNQPQLLLLDEPTASLDPSTARDVREQVMGLVHTEGCGILWTSHNMAEVETVCDRMLFLSRGRILLEGKPGDLATDHGAANLEELFVRLAREPLNTEERAA
jgi:ABC-2 type transport system ATP-binding protein